MDPTPGHDNQYSTAHAQLADCLREQKQELLERWEARVRSGVPALADIDAPSLRFGPAELLDQIACLVAGGPLAEAYGEIESAGARRHAVARLQVPGYSAADVVTEYHLLREELVETLVAEEGWSAGIVALVHARLDRAARDVIEQFLTPRASPLPDSSADPQMDRERERDEAERARTAFLCRVYRELRNPLCAMSAGAAFMQRAETTVEERQSFGARLARMCERQGALLEDLLEASRLLAPRWYCRSYPLDVATVLEAARREIQPLADEQQVKLAVTLPERRLLVRGDSHWLQRAVVQLLRNAVEHSRSGGLIWLAAARRGNEAVIGVRDNGAGIPPSLLPRIFEPLVSDGRGRFPRLARGWGLGLTIARSIVESHGGTLGAFSPGEDRGSDFVIRFPALPESVRPFRHVLLVHQHPLSAEGFVQEFQHVGCTVQHADSEESALAAVKLQCPEAVVIDFERSNMDGVALARRLREMLQPQSPYFIAFVSDLPFEPQPDLGDAFDQRAIWTGQPEALRELVLIGEGV